jgi:hypothetical protein
MIYKYLTLFLLSLVLQSTSAQIGRPSNSSQAIANNSTSGKNSIEQMQEEMIEAIVVTCQENINKDCAINDKVKSVVNSSCAKEKTKEAKDGCFTIAESILSSLLNNTSSQERQIYQKIYNQQPHVIEKIKQQKEQEGNRIALIEKEQEEKIEENKRALIKKQQEEIESSKNNIQESNKFVNNPNQTVNNITNNNSFPNSVGFFSSIYEWFANHILVVFAILTLICFLLIRKTMKLIDDGVGVFFVDGTDGVITFSAVVISGVIAGIFAYIFDTLIPSLNFELYYLFFTTCLALFICFRTIKHNSNNKTYQPLFLITKVILIVLVVAVIVIGILIMLTALMGRDGKQKNGESNAEYLNRQRAEKEGSERNAAAGAALAFGGVAGAAWSVSRLAMIKDEYNFSIASLTKWYLESFMTKEEIIASRNVSIAL